jgi:hypothetical protein
MKVVLAKRIRTATAILFASWVITAQSAHACGKKPWDSALSSSNVFVAPLQEPQALTGGANKQGENDSARIVGMWVVTFYVDGKKWDFAIEQFHEDGLEMTNDIYPPAVGNVCWGIWKSTPGVNNFTMKHTGVTFDNAGAYAGLFDFSASITVSADGDSFNGKFVADQEDVSGNILPSFHAEGILQAKRFKFDPPRHH